MINPLRYLRNYCRLKSVEITTNKYRLWGNPKLRLIFKPLLKYPFVKVIRIKVDGITYALMVLTQKPKRFNITNIEFVWVNPLKAKNPEDVTMESAYYQAMYDVFMHWHENIIMPTVVRKKAYNCNMPHTVAISLNITKEQQIERFRRILTLYGFNPDTSLTFHEELEFKTPYREKEQLTHVVYTRTI